MGEDRRNNDWHLVADYLLTASDEVNLAFDRIVADRARLRKALGAISEAEGEYLKGCHATVELSTDYLQRLARGALSLKGEE